MAKKNKPKVSVITPAYNTGDYIGKCLESLRMQTLPDIEIIVIEQESTDNTLETALSYAERDVRFKLISCRGIKCTGTARNIGLMAAEGDYICFADSDDFAEPDMLSEMYNAVYLNNADIAYCGVFVEDYVFKTTLKRTIHPHTKGLSDNRRFYDIFNNPQPWNKIYKRSLLSQNNILFPDYTNAEDLFFVCAAAAHADKIIEIDDKPLYHCLIDRPGSSTTELAHDFFDNIIANVSAVINHYKNTGMYKRFKTPLDAALFSYCHLSGIQVFYEKRMFSEIPEKLIAFVNESFPDIKANQLYETELLPVYNKMRLYGLLAQKDSLFYNGKNVIFSASKAGVKLLGYLNALNIEAECFLDNDRNKTGKTINGLTVLLPERIVDYNGANVIVAADFKFWKEIYAQLISLGVERSRIYP